MTEPTIGAVGADAAAPAAVTPTQGNPVRWIHGAPTAAGLGLDAVPAAFPARSGFSSVSAPDSDSEARSGWTSEDEPESNVDADTAPRMSEFAPIEDLALRLLGRKGLSRRELERQLDTAGYESGAVADELDRLESVGLIDDFALAQQLVVTLQERKGLGRGAIAAELARRVVAPAAIAYALDLVDDGEEVDRARELASKRLRSLQGLDEVTATRRLSAYLMRRGFSGTAVRAAVDSVRSA